MTELVGEFERPVTHDQRHVWRFGGAAIPKTLVYNTFRQRRDAQFITDQFFWLETGRVLDGCIQDLRLQQGYAGQPGRPRGAQFAPLSACCDAFKKESGVAAGTSGAPDDHVGAVTNALTVREVCVYTGTRTYT